MKKILSVLINYTCCVFRLDAIVCFAHYYIFSHFLRRTVLISFQEHIYRATAHPGFIRVIMYFLCYYYLDIQAGNIFVINPNTSSNPLSKLYSKRVNFLISMRV